MENDKLMIAVSATEKHGKTKSTIELIHLLYDELVLGRSADGWSAECLKKGCSARIMLPYNHYTYKYPEHDRMVVFKQKDKESGMEKKRIVVVTWGDVFEGLVEKSFDEILSTFDDYDVIVGCCHPNNSVWEFFDKKIKPRVGTFIAPSPFYVVKPKNKTTLEYWNKRFAEQLKDIVMDKINGKI